MPATSENRAYAHEVGDRLRAIRAEKGWSLQRVETLSGGRWKTAAVGSYERGDRMVSVEGLAALAGFYGVPVRELLPGDRSDAHASQTTRVVLDLPALTRVSTEDAAPLRRWVAEIQRERGDYAGRVLSIRAGDLRALATLYSLTRDEFTARLEEWKVLAPTSGVPGASA
jgi:transcriptional regulator with XRE-family HTH domain